MGRLRLAVVLGLAFVGFGGCLRTGADALSRDLKPSPGVTIHFDSGRYASYREVGAWAVGFGLAVLAAAVGGWVAREPGRAEPGAAADRRGRTGFPR